MTGVIAEGDLLHIIDLIGGLMSISLQQLQTFLQYRVIQ